MWYIFSASLDIEDEDDNKQEMEIEDEEMTAAETEDHQEPRIEGSESEDINRERQFHAEEDEYRLLTNA